jgi:hypothetical protein
VDLARFQRISNELVISIAGVDRAGDKQELLAKTSFELAPQLVRAAKQGHVRRIFVVGKANDPVDAVGRAHRVRDIERFQPKHPFPALGKARAYGRAHTADPCHDHVIPVHSDFTRPCHVLLTELRFRFVRGHIEAKVIVGDAGDGRDRQLGLFVEDAAGLDDEGRDFVIVVVDHVVDVPNRLAV